MLKILILWNGPLRCVKRPALDSPEVSRRRDDAQSPTGYVRAGLTTIVRDVTAVGENRN